MMNTHTFKIEKEITLHFKGGPELYISKINLGNDKYLLELSDRTRCIGRRKAHSELVADGMFKIFIDYYKRQVSYKEAIQIWEYAFGQEKNLEFVFVLRVSGRIVDQQIIGQLIEKYALRINSVVESRIDDTPEPMRIALFFPNRKKPIGTFFGHFLRKDFVFKI